MNVNHTLGVKGRTVVGKVGIYTMMLNKVEPWDFVASLTDWVQGGCGVLYLTFMLVKGTPLGALGTEGVAETTAVPAFSLQERFSLGVMGEFDFSGSLICRRLWLDCRQGR